MALSQEIAVVIVTAVETSNKTQYEIVCYSINAMEEKRLLFKTESMMQHFLAN
jgi:hypothetical protein